MKNEIVIYIKACHYKNSNYLDDSYCPIAKAARKQLKVKKVYDDVSVLKAGNRVFKHKRYGFAQYLKDYNTAWYNDFDDSVVRTIKLIEQ